MNRLQILYVWHVYTRYLHTNNLYVIYIHMYINSGLMNEERFNVREWLALHIETLNSVSLY